MINQKARSIPVLLFLLLNVIGVDAQCKLTNTAFASGEDIKYDLYLNLGFFNARAGRGSLSVTEANYRGENAYKMVMLFNTSGLAGSLYTVNDTLTSFIDKDIRPLLFTKEAFEGKDYSVERQSYTYDGDKVKIRAFRVMNGKEQFDEVVTTEYCTYDYLSVLPYIRNLDYADMRPGDRHHIRFIAGRKPVNMYVNYQGISSVKANNGKNYEVINLTMTILDDAFSNQKEALKASLTNDENRIPVIIDTTLRIGSIKAVLRDVSGTRHPKFNLEVQHPGVVF
ncbi:hypothetical protein PSM36_3379 [Proteiniphilum saccharofermentans]|uniref:Secreted protein n=2 Tax=Dysgonomonadaceae TaxID=2005520 RepID=A0A1R3TEV1_9BACT|nr:DUF3108 domain-containing protein [Proteiniphilum saccharofermentans]SCD22164.1 hypothetical protein PSM36_3379 [Proteiniphilum saccharofermentans]